MHEVALSSPHTLERVQGRPRSSTRERPNGVPRETRKMPRGPRPPSSAAPRRRWRRRRRRKGRRQMASG